MSALMSLAHEVSNQAATVQAAVPMATGDGILDWLTAKNSQTQAMLRAVAITIGIIFVIMQALLSRGAMARIIIAGIAAGVFVWIVWSVTDLKDRVENEINATGIVVQLDQGPAPEFSSHPVHVMS